MTRLPPLAGVVTPARAAGVERHAVVLVEGVSDQHALEALANRRGRDLDADGIAIVAMGGASNIGRFLDSFGPYGRNVALAGLFDAAEVGDFQRGLARAGLGSNLRPPEMESLGFHMCVDDLEDELIVEALDLTHVPRPLDGVLAHVSTIG